MKKDYPRSRSGNIKKCRQERRRRRTRRISHVKKAGRKRRRRVRKTKYRMKKLSQEVAQNHATKILDTFEMSINIFGTSESSINRLGLPEAISIKSTTDESSLGLALAVTKSRNREEPKERTEKQKQNMKSRKDEGHKKSQKKSLGTRYDKRC